MTDAPAIGFWKTVGLLLRASRRRSSGRQHRQRQLLENKSGKYATNWGGFGDFIAALLMAFLHGAAAFALIAAVKAGQHIDVEQPGKIIVSSSFLDRIKEAEHPAEAQEQEEELPAEEPTSGAGSSDDAVDDDDPLAFWYSDEARDIAHRYGGDASPIEKKLRSTVASSGSSNLISKTAAEPGLSALGTAGSAGPMFGSLILVIWLAMLICQGEGLELDLQRRRHPIWEWLLSHPIGAGAAFFSEMLSPLTANPTYWMAPLFVGIVYGESQGAPAGIGAAVLIGIPLTIAASCAGKALEIGAMLRLPPRSRGAVIGLMGWFGYAAMIGMIFGLSYLPMLVEGSRDWIRLVARMPWSVLGLFLGLRSDGSFSFMNGALFCWAISAFLILSSVIFSARSIRNGLSGAFATESVARSPRRKANFGRDPLYRKEYLWFIRDRSAIVQTILIPLTVAGFQAFNLRGVVGHAQDSWNYLSGAAILLGTYFLWVLGPKSLVSEGSALWLALTWPRGLESVLKAKAWLWSMIASALVMAVLVFGCWIFPQESWKIALVAVGWFFFGRSMAEKAVTLVTVVTESGEAEKVPSGRRWAAQLGMLTFAIGIVTQQWNLAIVGIVYSWITAAAMWENLRARLPYLFDPWSEVLPQPPTLMHAMVSISILIECGSIVTGLVFAIGGKDSLAIAQAIGYAVCAVGVSIGVSNFMSDRGVVPARIWCWREDGNELEKKEPWIRRYIAGNRTEAYWLLAGIGGGLMLATVAHFYIETIQLIPSVGELIRASDKQMQSIPNLQVMYAIMAVGFAPFAEEYLFRGLVFRALDRQWGGWRAVAGAAAFFAIYHPPLAWVPVGLVGAANCLLFKQSKRLAPAVLLHMAYNAVIVIWN